MMKIDISTLRNYEKDKWLVSQKHPVLPLIIWNYSQFTQYEAKWDDITLQCRGLITDTEGNVVSRGFPKFFNYSEGRTTIPLDVDYITVYEKIDGSYIGLFYYNDEWIVNSKGSFSSDQVMWAKEILKDKDLSGLDTDVTYCFELIHPENRIVCNYHDRVDLVYLSGFENEYGTEIGLLDRPENFTLPLIEMGLEWSPSKLQALNFENEEGFVIRFDNGERCKIKFDEYVRLHSIVTNTSSYNIWRCLKEGDDFSEILDRTPDEFNSWIKLTKFHILAKFHSLKGEVYLEFCKFLANTETMTDKNKALYINNNLEFSPQIFALKNNKNIDKWLWEKAKPSFKKAFQI